MEIENNERILVVGATGALGLEIVKLLKEKNKNVRVLVLSPEDKPKVAPFTDDIFVGDASEAVSEIENLTEGITTVISALGKSLSLFSPSDDSFYESDYKANKNILEDAIKNKVRRFIYISIKGCDVREDLSIAKAHKMFEDELRASGLEYTILRPVGFYSGLNDLAIMAKRKMIPIIGDGLARTNSIHQEDLAEVVVKFLNEGPELIEVGGPQIHTRLEMAEMIKEKIGGQIIKIPKNVAEVGVAIPKFFSDDMGDKLDYFTFITTNDMIGESHGSITFKDYLKTLDIKKLP
ncbi:SDR family oxidoreductase [soil metagenome]